MFEYVDWFRIHQLRRKVDVQPLQSVSDAPPKQRHVVRSRRLHPDSLQHAQHSSFVAGLHGDQWSARAQYDFEVLAAIHPVEQVCG
jgi:hypothetical protein